MSATRVAVALAATALIAGPAMARTLLTQEEALRQAFPPPATVERRPCFLSAAERDRARQHAGTAIDSEVWIQYVARGDDGRPLGTAYFDTHLVRTLPETLMVVLAPDGSVVSVEVLSFSEPADYMPKKAWFGQFPGHRLDPDLAANRAIRSVSGATLSARAAIAAVRRVLAVHQVLAERAPAPAAPGARP